MPRPKLLSTLDLPRCPDCGVDKPYLELVSKHTHKNVHGVERHWAVYKCARCAGFLIAEGSSQSGILIAYHPDGTRQAADELPARAKNYLDQALASLNAPSGAVMLAACAIDAMLKAMNLKDGSLYARIEKAAKDHLITDEMAAWAHDVRLDANDERHVDDNATMPTDADARRVIEFASALGDFLFVLPARVKRGRAAASSASGGT
jgi:hypothetical protein